MHTRDLIGQAKGILMERHKITADEAFAMLVRSSQSANTKLRDVADHLVRIGQLPPEQAESPCPRRCHASRIGMAQRVPAVWVAVCGGRSAATVVDSHGHEFGYSRRYGNIASKVSACLYLKPLISGFAVEMKATAHFIFQYVDTEFLKIWSV
ncbi:hypothetical protein GCM10009634_75020 [Saccharothrix xinjiangensis]